MHQDFDRSVLCRWFTNPAARSYHLHEDRDAVGRSLVASARVAYARGGVGLRAAQIVAAVLDRSPEFAVWKNHDVSQPAELSKRILHPKLGLLELHCQHLHDPTQPHTLMVFTAEPGSPVPPSSPRWPLTPSHMDATTGADVDQHRMVGSAIRGSPHPE